MMTLGKQHHPESVEAKRLAKQKGMGAMTDITELEYARADMEEPS